MLWRANSKMISRCVTMSASCWKSGSRAAPATSPNCATQSPMPACATTVQPFVCSAVAHLGGGLGQADPRPDGRKELLDREGLGYHSVPPPVSACIVDSLGSAHTSSINGAEHEYTGTWEGHRRLCAGWGAQLPLQSRMPSSRPGVLTRLGTLGSGCDRCPSSTASLGKVMCQRGDLGDELSVELPRVRRGSGIHARRVYAHHRH